MGRFVSGWFVLAAVCLTAAACDNGTELAGPSPTALTVGPGGTFARIQDAVDAAAAGATIVVLPGTYAEHVTVTKPVNLQANQAILDGLAGGLDGRYLGFHVLSNDVEISGFVVQNFERGIVLDHVSNCRVRGNEVRNNTSKDPQPISTGVTKADGIVLMQVQNSVVAENFVHDNGNVGLGVWASSGGNSIRGNRVINNGTQQIRLPGGGLYGVGIYSIGGNNTRNDIVDNEIAHSHWGILLGSAPDSANTLRNNRVHNNGRAGIAVQGAHNRIEGNDASGNGLLNIAPSCQLDLVDFRELDNDWVGNTGRFGADIPATRSGC